MCWFGVSIVHSDKKQNILDCMGDDFCQILPWIFEVFILHHLAEIALTA